MKQYIDKSAVVAEIENLISALKEHCNPNPFGDTEECMAAAEIEALNTVLDTINTFEVKEVDFDEEWRNYFKYKGDMATVNVKHLAKHFYELGLFSTLTWQDIRLIAEIGNDFMNSEESDNLTDEAYYGAILDKVRQKGRDAKTSWSENRKAREE